jgi:mRNA interferase RelE/StbE
MKYDIEIKPRALKDLRQLDATQRKRVVQKIESMANGLGGDIKQLTNFTPEYRLRVGDYRVLFEMESAKIVIYRVRHRREAYE